MAGDQQQQQEPRPGRAAVGVRHRGLPRQPHAADHRHLRERPARQPHGENQRLQNNLQGGGRVCSAEYRPAVLPAEKRDAIRFPKEKGRFGNTALFPPVGGGVHQLHLRLWPTCMNEARRYLVYFMLLFIYLFNRIHIYVFFYMYLRRRGRGRSYEVAQW